MAKTNSLHQPLGASDDPKEKQGPLLAVDDVLVFSQTRRLNRRSEPIRAVVDTGSRYTLVPKSALDQAGAKRVHGQRIFAETATGQPCEFDVYDVWLRLPDFEEVRVRVGGQEDGRRILLGTNIWNGKRLFRLSVLQYPDRDRWTLTLDD